jgi:hypothetical protein
MMVRFLAFAFLSVFSVACDTEHTFVPEAAPLPGEAAVLELLNDPTTTHTRLDQDVRLDRRAATCLIEHRNGADGFYGTDDDNLFGSLLEVELMPHVGPVTVERLRTYAVAQGFGE